MPRTKCIVIGENDPTKIPKKIVFTKSLSSTGDFGISTFPPKSYDNIELICKHYAADFDIMFAYNQDRPTGLLYLGKWNDGVV